MTTTEDDVRAFILAHLETRLTEVGVDGTKLSDESDLFAEGVVDSLGVVEVIAAVSDRYGIEDDWDDYDPNDLLVIGAFCRFVADKARQRARTQP